MRNSGSSLWAPAPVRISGPEHSGAGALEQCSGLSKPREDSAPGTQSLKCLSQRQTFLPLSPVDGLWGATLCWVGFSLRFSFRRWQLSEVVHRPLCVCPAPNVAFCKAVPCRHALLCPPRLSSHPTHCLRSAVGSWFPGAEHGVLSGAAGHRVVSAARVGFLWPQGWERPCPSAKLCLCLASQVPPGLGSLPAEPSRRPSPGARSHSGCWFVLGPLRWVCVQF